MWSVYSCQVRNEHSNSTAIIISLHIHYTLPACLPVDLCGLLGVACIPLRAGNLFIATPPSLPFVLLLGQFRNPL